MTETRAVAKLPHVDIEILHRQLPEEGAELLSITLRGTPDLGTAARLLDPFGLLDSGASPHPWAAWMQLAWPWVLWQRGGPWAALLDGRRG
jgi:hypothetical protein